VVVSLVGLEVVVVVLVVVVLMLMDLYCRW